MGENKTNGIRVMTTDGSVMLMVIDSTDIVNEAFKIHQSTPAVTAALGRTLTAGSLIGAQLKGANHSLTLKIKGDGPVGTILVVSDSNGNVRGYPVNPGADAPNKPNGKLNVSGVVGKSGTMQVIKDLGLAKPFIGVTNLVSGEIAEDITYYYANSEQIPTVCALGVLVNTDLTVKKAGGFLLQLLPNTPDDVIDKIEGNIKDMKSITEMLEKGMNLEDITNLVLRDFEWNILEEYTAEYKCTCDRERVEKVLITLSEKDLNDAFDENELIGVTCQFCDKVYNFDKEDSINLKKHHD